VPATLEGKGERGERKLRPNLLPKSRRRGFWGDAGSQKGPKEALTTLWPGGIRIRTTDKNEAKSRGRWPGWTAGR